MEHLYKFLTRKSVQGFRVEDVIKMPCTVTLKIDGNAFQIATDESTGEVKYYKRSGEPDEVREDKEITTYDCCFNSFYGDAIKFFTPKEKLLKGYDLLNFEIIDKTHTIDYGSTEDPKVYLLSAFKDRNAVSDSELESLAEDLGVSVVPVVMSGEALPNNIINVLRAHIKEARSLGPFKVKDLAETTAYSDVTDAIGSDTIDWGSQEGLVLTWDLGDDFVSAKLDNPMFINKWYELQEEESEEKKVDYTTFGRSLSKVMLSHYRDWLSEGPKSTKLENVLQMVGLFTDKDIRDLYDSYGGAKPFLNPASSPLIAKTDSRVGELAKDPVFHSVLNMVMTILINKKGKRSKALDTNTKEKINAFIDKFSTDDLS